LLMVGRASLSPPGRSGNVLLPRTRCLHGRAAVLQEAECAFRRRWVTVQVALQEFDPGLAEVLRFVIEFDALRDRLEAESPADLDRGLDDDAVRLRLGSADELLGDLEDGDRQLGEVGEAREAGAEV